MIGECPLRDLEFRKCSTCVEMLLAAAPGYFLSTSLRFSLSVSVFTSIFYLKIACNFIFLLSSTLSKGFIYFLGYRFCFVLNFWCLGSLLLAFRTTFLVLFSVCIIQWQFWRCSRLIKPQALYSLNFVKQRVIWLWLPNDDLLRCLHKEIISNNTFVSW